MNRRDLFSAGAGVALAQVLASAVACADQPASAPTEKKDDPHAHHNHAPGDVGVQNAAFVQTVHECLAAADVCLQHCLQLLAAGDTSMERCSQIVNQMRAVCQATAVVAASGSKHVKATAALCVQLCEDCEEACREHENEHLACKNCADACKKTAAAARELA